MKLKMIGILIFLTFFMIEVTAKTKTQIKPWPITSVKKVITRDEDKSYNKVIPFNDFKKMIAVKTKSKIAKKSIFLEVEPSLQVKNYTLIPAQSPVKNQMNRGQCHNFATTASFEYAIWLGENSALDFSEQCNAWKFYYECTGCNGYPNSENDGGFSNMETAFIFNKFMKFETDYPYSSNASLCQNNYNDAPYYQFKNIISYEITYDVLKKAIDSNYVVIYSGWWRKLDWNNFGEHPYLDSYSACISITCGGHAVLLVGYDDNYYGLNKGGIIFKNSWGSYWGNEKESKPKGYGVLPYPYVKQFEENLTAVSYDTGNIPKPQGCSCNN